MKLKLPDNRWLFALAVALLCGAGVLLHRLPAVPAALLLGPTPTPAPAAEEAPPTPAPVEGAVTVLADGAPVLTLSSRAEAETLLSERLAAAAQDIPEGETLVSASFALDMALREAESGEEPVSLEQARAAVAEDPALCPVSTQTRVVTAEPVAFTTEETKDARIPKGARLILQLGRPGELVSITSSVYLNGERQGCPMVTQEQTLAPLEERVAVGTYTSGHPDREPGREEGEKGPKAPEGFSLAIKGEIQSNFGMRKGSMHEGLDIAAKVGDTVAAPAAGTVVYAGRRGSYGFLLEIDHGGGFVTRVTPIAECSLKAGDAVTAGQSVGVLAAPEDEEDIPHLYLELLINGVPYNPRQYLS